MSAHKIGRPTKLTEDRAHRITELLRNGNTIEAACAATNLGTTTYYRWLETGEADEEHDRTSPERDFREAVTRALGESEAILTGFAFSAARKDGRVALEMLARRFPQRWSPRTEAHVTAQTTSRVVVASDEADDAARIAEVTAVLGQIGVLGEPA